jgi:hypothetical protein
MRSIVLAACLFLTALHATATLWSPPRERSAWFATNENGFCSLQRAVATDEAKLEFSFVSGLAHGNEPDAITFQVVATPAKLGWPMHLSVGSEPNAPPFVLGLDPASPNRLEGPEVQRLLALLKAGRGLDVTYLLVGDAEIHLYLDAYKFPQAVAMFEACNAHVA